MCFDRVWDVQLQLHRSGWQRGAHPVSCSRVSTLPPMLMRLTPFIKLPSHECCMPAQSLLLPPAPPWAEFFDFENWLNHNFSRNAFLFSANCRLQGFKKLSRARCPNFPGTRSTFSCQAQHFQLGRESTYAAQPEQSQRKLTKVSMFPLHRCQNGFLTLLERR